MGDDLAACKIDHSDLRPGRSTEMHGKAIPVERHRGHRGTCRHRQIDAQRRLPGMLGAAVTLASCAGCEA